MTEKNKTELEYLPTPKNLSPEDIGLLTISRQMILTKLCLEAESAGGKVIKVNPRNTSQKCSACGNAAKKTLATRTHKCSCGLKIDRDTNAALNILAIGKIGLEQPELSLKEMVPLHSVKAGLQAPSMKQEAITSTPKGLGYE